MEENINEFSNESKFEMLISLLLGFLIIIWMGKFINLNIYRLIGKVNMLIVLVILIPIVTLLLIEKKIPRNDIRLMVLFNIFLFFNLVMTKSNLGSVILVDIFFLMFIISTKIFLKERTILSLNLIFFVYNIFWINSNYKIYNANTIGIIGMILFFINFILMGQIKRKIFKIPVLILILKDFDIIIKSASRGSLGGILVFLILFLLLGKIVLKNRFFFNISIIMSTLGSIIFVYSYIYLWLSSGVENTFIFGKRLFTGREKIWYELYLKFKEKIFVGLGSDIKLHSFGSLNVHNSFYDLLVIYGIFVFLILICLILKTFNMNYKTIQRNNLSKISFFIIIGILISSFIETTFINITHYPIILFLLIVINSGGRGEKNAEYLYDRGYGK